MYIFTEQCVDGQSIFDLSEKELADVGIKLGPRKKLMRFINGTT